MEITVCLSCYPVMSDYMLMLEGMTGCTEGETGMDEHVHAGLLEWIVKGVRDQETRHEGETLDAYFKRTWQQALREYEEVKPKLPNVERAKERSNRLLAVAGKIEQEKENEE